MDEKYSKLDSEHLEPALSEFYEEFISDRYNELPELNKGIEEKNFGIIEELSHKWKGFSAPYGFAGLAQIAALMETSAKNKDIESSQRLAKEVIEYLKYKKSKRG